MRSGGQTATEYMLLISVLVIAIVGAAFAFVPSFREGVDDLGRDVKEMLGSGDLGDRGAEVGSGASPP